MAKKHSDTPAGEDAPLSVAELQAAVLALTIRVAQLEKDSRTHANTFKSIGTQLAPA